MFLNFCAQLLAQTRDFLGLLIGLGQRLGIALLQSPQFPCQLFDVALELAFFLLGTQDVQFGQR